MRLTKESIEQIDSSKELTVPDKVFELLRLIEASLNEYFVEPMTFNESISKLISPEYASLKFRHAFLNNTQGRFDLVTKIRNQFVHQINYVPTKEDLIYLIETAKQIQLVMELVPPRFTESEIAITFYNSLKIKDPTLTIKPEVISSIGEKTNFIMDAVISTELQEKIIVEVKSIDSERAIEKGLSQLLFYINAMNSERGVLVLPGEAFYFSGNILVFGIRSSYEKLIEWMHQ